MTIALVILLLTGVFRLFYMIYEYRKDPRARPAGWIRALIKPIYRTLEFFYKTTMYPLIFFSMVTLFNWNAYRISEGTLFHDISRGFAVGFICIYTLITIFSVFF